MLADATPVRPEEGLTVTLLGSGVISHSTCIYTTPKTASLVTSETSTQPSLSSAKTCHDLTPPPSNSVRVYTKPRRRRSTQYAFKHYRRRRTDGVGKRDSRHVCFGSTLDVRYFGTFMAAFLDRFKLVSAFAELYRKDNKTNCDSCDCPDLHARLVRHRRRYHTDTRATGPSCTAVRPSKDIQTSPNCRSMRTIQTDESCFKDPRAPKNQAEECPCPILPSRKSFERMPLKDGRPSSCCPEWRPYSNTLAPGYAFPEYMPPSYTHMSTKGEAHNMGTMRVLGGTNRTGMKPGNADLLTLPNGRTCNAPNLNDDPTVMTFSDLGNLTISVERKDRTSSAGGNTRDSVSKSAPDTAVREALRCSSRCYSQGYLDETHLPTPAGYYGYDAGPNKYFSANPNQYQQNYSPYLNQQPNNSYYQNENQHNDQIWSHKQKCKNIECPKNQPHINNPNHSYQPNGNYMTGHQLAQNNQYWNQEQQPMNNQGLNHNNNHLNENQSFQNSQYWNQNRQPKNSQYSNQTQQPYQSQYSGHNQHPYDSQYSNQNRQPYNNQFSNHNPQHRNDQYQNNYQQPTQYQNGPQTLGPKISRSGVRDEYGENMNTLSKTNISVIKPQQPPATYEEALKREVGEWLYHLPFYPNMKPELAPERQKNIDEFIQRIIALKSEFGGECYDKMVADELEKWVDKMKIWYPGEKKDQTPFRQELCCNLLKKLNEINSSWAKHRNVSGAMLKDGVDGMYCRPNYLVNRSKSAQSIRCSVYDDYVGNDKICNDRSQSYKNELRHEIWHWFNETRLWDDKNDGCLDKNEIVEVIMNNIDRHLKKPYTSINVIIVKAKIMEVLDNHPTYVDKSQRPRVIRYAEELAKRLLSLQENALCSKFTTKTDDLDSKIKIRNEIQSRVIYCLQNTNLKDKLAITEQITTFILRNLDCLRIGESKTVKDGVVEILQKTRQISIVVMYNIVNCILDEVYAIINPVRNDNVVYCTNEITHIDIVASSDDFTRSKLNNQTSYSANDNRANKPSIGSRQEHINGNNVTNSFKLRKSVGVFTSLCNVEASCLDITKGESVNKVEYVTSIDDNNEALYLMNLSNTIRAWLLNLSHQYNVILDDNFKTLITNDLSSDIVSQTKLNQLKNLKINKERFWQYFIYRWVKKFDVFEDIDKAEFEIRQLEESLKRIHVPNMQMEKKQGYFKQDKNQRTNLCNGKTQMLYKVERLPTFISPFKSIAANKNNPDSDIDIIIKKLIRTYTTHKNAVHDPMTRRVFIRILKSELEKLLIANMNYETSESVTMNQNRYDPRHLEKELHYIKDISNWLKKMPLAHYFSTIGNKERAAFVTSLATNVVEIEEEQVKHSNCVDYKTCLYNTITKIIKQLPILPNKDDYVTLMIKQLVHRISENRYIPRKKHSRNVEQSFYYIVSEYCRLIGEANIYDAHIIDAYSKRLIMEIKYIINKNIPKDATIKEPVELLQTKPVIKFFSMKLDYCKETADWIQNLPLIYNDTELIADMVRDMAENIAKRDEKATYGDPKARKGIVDYITNWIQDLPLDGKLKIDIPVSIQQLINRINLVNETHSDILYSTLKAHRNFGANYHVCYHLQNPISYDINCIGWLKCNSKKKSQGSGTCRTKKKEISTPSDYERCLHLINMNTLNDKSVVSVIEKWSNNLLLYGNEPDVKAIKGEIKSKLFEVVRKLNDNPLISDNNILFKSTLGDSIEEILKQLPENIVLEEDKQQVKDNLLAKVMDAKIAAEVTDAADLYQQKLKRAIESSMPVPLQRHLGADPVFDIFKHRLSEKFILDNFDHSEDEKQIYEEHLQIQIHGLFPSALKRNAVPINEDNLCNSLYSALYKVPIPDTSMKDKVEEIKTRCEIDTWYRELPLLPPKATSILSERNELLKTLARNIHDTETNAANLNGVVHNKIVQFLNRLHVRVESESKIEDFATKLVEQLNNSEARRKYVPRPNHAVQGAVVKKNSKETNVIRPVLRKKWTAPTMEFSEQYQVMTVTACNSADLILKTVEEWCLLVPLPFNSEEAELEVLRDKLANKIIIKLSEVNSNKDMLNNDVYYDHVLGNELHTLLGNFTTADAVQKEALKRQLLESLRLIRPIARNEVARYEYKRDLKNTAATILNLSGDANIERNEMNNINEEIANSFLEYNYNMGDIECQQFYKKAIEDAAEVYIAKIECNPNNARIDPLVLRNRLISEMKKLHPANEAAIAEEIQEIRIGYEIEDFFDEIDFQSESSQDTPRRLQQKRFLTKQLHEMEKAGHNVENENEMKRKIIAVLKLLGKEISSDKIDMFVARLKENEAERKAPPPKCLKRLYFLNETSGRENLSNSATNQNFTVYSQSSHDLTESQWLSKDKTTSRTPCPGTCCKPNKNSKYEQTAGPVTDSNQSQLNINRNLDNTVPNYSQFRQDPQFASTPVPQQAPQFFSSSVAPNMGSGMQRPVDEANPGWSQPPGSVAPNDSQGLSHEQSRMPPGHMAGGVVGGPPEKSCIRFCSKCTRDMSQYGPNPGLQGSQYQSQSQTQYPRPGALQGSQMQPGSSISPNQGARQKCYGNTCPFQQRQPSLQGVQGVPNMQGMIGAQQGMAGVQDMQGRQGVSGGSGPNPVLQGSQYQSQSQTQYPSPGAFQGSQMPPGSSNYPNQDARQKCSGIACPFKQRQPSLQGVQGVPNMHGMIGAQQGMTGVQDMQGRQGVSGGSGPNPVLQGSQYQSQSHTQYPSPGALQGSQMPPGSSNYPNQDERQKCSGIACPFKQRQQSLQGVHGIPGVQGMVGAQGRAGAQDMQGTQGVSDVSGANPVLQGSEYQSQSQTQYSGPEALHGSQMPAEFSNYPDQDASQKCYGNTCPFMQNEQNLQSVPGIPHVQGVIGAQQGMAGVQDMQGMQYTPQTRIRQPSYSQNQNSSPMNKPSQPFPRRCPNRCCEKSTNAPCNVRCCKELPLVPYCDTECCKPTNGQSNGTRYESGPRYSAQTAPTPMSTGVHPNFQGNQMLRAPCMQDPNHQNMYMGVDPNFSGNQNCSCSYKQNPLAVKRCSFASQCQQTHLTKEGKETSNIGISTDATMLSQQTYLGNGSSNIGTNTLDQSTKRISDTSNKATNTKEDGTKCYCPAPTRPFCSLKTCEEIEKLLTCLPRRRCQHYQKNLDLNSRQNLNNF